MALELQFGLNRVIPDNATSAWGCRGIYDKQIGIDILWDRTGQAGTKDIVSRLEAEYPIDQLRADIKALVQSYRMTPESSEIFNLHEKDGLHVMCSASRSFGYVYVAAWI